MRIEFDAPPCPLVRRPSVAVVEDVFPAPVLSIRRWNRTRVPFLWGFSEEKMLG
jgi:hypothetical protein